MWFPRCDVCWFIKQSYIYNYSSICLPYTNIYPTVLQDGAPSRARVQLPCIQVAEFDWVYGRYNELVT